jgi:colanic acid biosynthesis glycosyl transferase WcaI
VDIKNITFIGLNYYPEDTAIGLYSTQWVDYLSHQGFKVSVITAFPYYPHWKIKEEYSFKNTFLKEERGNIKIYRYKQYVPKAPTLMRRIIHILDFTFGSFINLYKIKNCDLVISVVPFTSSSLLGYIQKRRFKAKLWVHVQDFEFDAALNTGLFNNKKFSLSILFKLEKWLFSKSDIASTISHSMLKKLKEKTKSELFYFPNWIENNSINTKTHPYLDYKKFKILYSGNIGEKQDWETFVQFCKDLDKEKFQIIIIGSGAKKSWLKEKTYNISNVTHFPPVPFDEISDLLSSADFHLLFQNQNIIDSVMPSKVLGMMASGKPSIIIGNKESEAGKIIKASKGGLFYTHYEKTIIKDIIKLLENRNDLIEMGNNARKYVVQNFSKSIILSSILDKIKEL